MEWTRQRRRDRGGRDPSPGRALDLGCADGGDAIWLAQRGWQVTGVDVSATVLRRARVQVATAGLGDRVDFQRHDVSESLPDGTFDLIVASHFHSPIDFPRNQVFRSTAQMLSPHGVLLIVDHASTAPGRGTRTPITATRHLKRPLPKSASTLRSGLPKYSRLVIERRAVRTGSRRPSPTT